MIFDTEFDGGVQLGAVVQGIGLSEPEYVRLDGRTLSRASYSRLSSIYPIGKLTGTARTLAAIPAGYGLAASPNYFLSTAANGTAPIQYSSDGVTWSTSSVSMTAGAIACAIWAGNRWVAVYTTSVVAMVTSGDNPNSTWTACTGSYPTSLSDRPQNKMAYSPSLTRVVCLPHGASTSVATLDGGTNAWVSRTGLTSLDRRGVCWSGSKFVSIAAASAASSSSTDGITWTDSLFPEATTAGNGSIASNGAGVIVASGFASGMYASFDHGANWSQVFVPGLQPVDTWRVQFSGDRFFLPMANGVAMSLDGRDWFIETQPVHALNANTSFAKKGAVIVQTQATTAAYSFSESANDFSVHNIRVYTPALSGVPISLVPLFIKAL